MAKFKKNTKSDGAKINTSSLPDIVFMLLFFFMVVTKMREREMKVNTQVPDATEVEKMEKKSRVTFIYVGPPVDENLGDGARIQLDDAFATVDDIPEFITKFRETKPEKEIPFLSTSLKADISVKMGTITDIKQELREINALKLNYSARKAAEE